MDVKAEADVENEIDKSVSEKTQSSIVQKGFTNLKNENLVSINFRQFVINQGLSKQIVFRSNQNPQA